MVAALTGNRNDGEADIVLLSAKDRGVIQNLTIGLHRRLRDTWPCPTASWPGAPSASTRAGTRVAFFARTGKRRSLFLVSVLTGKILKRVPLDLDQAQSPCLLPDGRHALFSAIKEGVSDIYLLDLEERHAPEPDPGLLLRLRPAGLARTAAWSCTRGG